MAGEPMARADQARRVADAELLEWRVEIAEHDGDGFHVRAQGFNVLARSDAEARLGAVAETLRQLGVPQLDRFVTPTYAHTSATPETARTRYLREAQRQEASHAR
jgi:predicted deacetylase